MRQALLYPGEDGQWVAECPSLPGCVSQGQDKEQAIANLREAIDGYIVALKADNLPALPRSASAFSSCGGASTPPSVPRHE